MQGGAMKINKVTQYITVSPQIMPGDVKEIADLGYKVIICNRPDGEGADQPSFKEIEVEAKKYGLEAIYLPVVSGKVTDKDAQEFMALVPALAKPIFAYCRSGMRSITLWALSQASQHRPVPEILEAAKLAGYDLYGVARRILNEGKTPTDTADIEHDIVVVGAGALLFLLVLVFLLL